MEFQRILPNDCQLSTKGNFNLIDILYQQDLDLGVDKEIFDPLCREKREQERKLELTKQQEWQKAQLLEKEKEEQEKRELKDKWLKQNFRRDGETGEWVQLWPDNKQIENNFIDNDYNKNDNYISLQDALDFLGSIGTDEKNNDLSALPDDSVLEMQTQQFETMLQQEQPFLAEQDNFDENWNGLVDFLNMTANKMAKNANNNPHTSNFHFNNDRYNSIRPVLGHTADNRQTGHLIQNLEIQSSAVNMNTIYNTVTAVEKPSPPELIQPENYTPGSDISDIGIFNNPIVIQSSSADDNDLAGVGELLRNIEEADREIELDKALIEHMDAIKKQEFSINMSTSSMGSSSPGSVFSDAFGSLEGSTGSYNSNNHCDLSNSFAKTSHISESSNDSGYAYQGGFSSPSSSSLSSSPPYYGDSPASSSNGITNSFSNSNAEDYQQGMYDMTRHHKNQSHPYDPAPGQVPREVKKYAHREPLRKGPQSRDQRHAHELQIPFTLQEIIDSSVEKFNEMLTAHKLNETQLNLIRDIRRRGKNKVAAQNCRKRKVSVVYSLADEITELQKMRDRLVAERAVVDREKHAFREKFGYLYTHIFQSLRNEHGEPYDPKFYSLQQSIDGSVFIVPRNLSASTKDGSISSSPSLSNDSIGSNMHKSF